MLLELKWFAKFVCGFYLFFCLILLIYCWDGIFGCSNLILWFLIACFNNFYWPSNVNFFFLFCYLEVPFVYLKIALFWNSAWFGCDGLSSVLCYNMLIGLNISRLTFLDFMLAEISRTGILNCSNRWVPWLYSVHDLSYISVMFCSFKYIIYTLNFYQWVSLPSDSWNVFVTWNQWMS